MSKEELQAVLDEKGIKYDKRWGEEKLLISLGSEPIDDNPVEPGDIADITKSVMSGDPFDAIAIRPRHIDSGRISKMNERAKLVWAGQSISLTKNERIKMLKNSMAQHWPDLLDHLEIPEC